MFTELIQLTEKDNTVAVGLVYLKSETSILLQFKLKIKAKIGYNKLNALMISILTLALDNICSMIKNTHTRI